VEGLAAGAVVDDRGIEIFEFGNNSLRNKGFVPSDADATFSSGSKDKQKKAHEI
jgi:hypothetical protein